MRNGLLVFLLIVVLGGGAARAGVPREIDPFYFMLGVISGTQYYHYLAFQNEPVPKQVEFFSSDERAAGMYLEAVRQWTGRKDIEHYEGLVIVNEEMTAKLDEFYRHDGISSIAWRDRREQLSYLAGFYAVSYTADDGMFHAGGAGEFVNTALLILLQEGCEVTDRDWRKREVPDTVHFRVKPTKKIADLFTKVDGWQPKVEWKKK